ncbi:MAG: V-type ATP synthase subunit E [Methanomicrobiaceae archaeon]|uniref:V-type atp synthase subunit e n=1 Tax=hydrocarbon metagenome TaxID=938273 RepID=A0A0W8FHP6_9ZZZZ|nr:V-type ATP synthase subunit E [Methanomicrobiaceae archaeon]MDD5418320.1 V-type ATP synthase subunit E family protein [Methanomicrobiaceae archaeon]
MGLEAVVDDIRNKGRREAGAIRSETQAEVNRILEAAQERVEEIKLGAERDVSGQIQKITDQEVSAANLVVKRQILNAQREILDQVYQSTLAALSDLPENFHHEAVRKLLMQAAGEIREGVVYCNRRDMPVVKDLIARESSFAGYRLGDAVEIEGGVIVESIDGDLKIDLSYRTFLDGMWESGLKDASDILFA